MGTKRRYCLTIGIVTILLLIAAACRYLPGQHLMDKILGNTIRRGIHIILLVVRMHSLHQRMLNKKVSEYLQAVAILLIFWITERSIKYDLPYEMHTLNRYLWYCFYIPLLFVPLFGFFFSLHLGKPENYVLPRSIRFLYIPAFLLLAMVMTNDLHEFVFINPNDRYYYTRGLGYILIIIWIGIFFVLT